ncbi:MAG: acetyltransferase [Prevotella sp.]|nr:acetyltransferase [Prevotella sp.]
MVLYGASGHAKVIKDLLESQRKIVDYFVDDNPDVKELCGLPVRQDLPVDETVIISIGNNAVRKKIAERIANQFETGIAISAIVASTASVGEGSVVMQGAIIQPEVGIGKHCIINTGASIDHECVIEDYVHVSPHATLCGNVHVGEGTWIGAGTTIIQGVKIGKWCMIGAGSVVTKDIPDGYLAVGNRCKLIKKINQELL